MTYQEDKVGEIPRAIAGRTSIYIDAANLEQSVKEMFVIPRDIPEDLKSYQPSDLRWRVDYEKLKRFFSVYGIPGEIHYYTPEFATDSHRKFRSFLKNRLQFKLTTKPLKEYRDHTPETPHRKANFDVEISIEAVLQREEYKTFILFSGDCDFEYLLKFLRGQGKTCIVFSMRGHVADELLPAANYYFDLIDLRHSLLRIQPRDIGRYPDAKRPAF